MLPSTHTRHPVDGDKQLWEERENANTTADISHGFHSPQQLTSSHSLHLFPSQLHTSFDRLVKEKKKRDLQNMAVGRRQGLVAHIPFLTF